MKRLQKSKYINFFFKDYYDYSNKNKLPEMRKSKTNRDMNNTYNQEEINKRILRKINYNFILNQFNLYCKKSNKPSKKSAHKYYLNNISDEFFNNLNYYSRNKKINFKTSTNFYRKSKNDLLSSLNDNLFEKDNNLNNEDEKVYDFRQKFTAEKDRIIQLKNEYKFYNIPKYIKDEIASKKIQKIFGGDYTFDLNNKCKPKIRTIARLKNHSFNEKFHLDYSETKTIGKINKNRNLKKYNSNLNSIDNFMSNDLNKINYFNSVSTSDFKIKLEKSFKKGKYNMFLNCMKLTKKMKS